MADDTPTPPSATGAERLTEVARRLSAWLPSPDILLYPGDFLADVRLCVAALAGEPEGVKCFACGCESCDGNCGQNGHVCERPTVDGGWLTAPPHFTPYGAVRWMEEALAQRAAKEAAEREYCRKLCVAAGLFPDQLTTIDDCAGYWVEREKVMLSELNAAEAEVAALTATVAGLREVAEEAFGVLDAHTDAAWSDEVVALRARLAALTDGEGTDG